MQIGGKQTIPRLGRGSRITKGCLEPPGHEGAAGAHDREVRFAEGTVQHFEFRVGDTVNPAEAAKYPEGPPLGGGLGVAKGLLQILWERGLWTADMDNADARNVLRACEDFVTEMTMLEKRIFDRGHLLTMSPKGHPELAGLGIEYSWGKSKREFRQHNDCDPKNLHENIIKAFECLPWERVMRFARKTREYKRGYAKVHGLFGHTAEDALAGFAAVEKFVKHSKCHRFILDQDTAACEGE